MMPVNINAQNISGSHAAASQIAFGAVVISAAAGTLKSTLAPVHNVVGIAMNDEVEKTVDGFYAQYDQLPVVTSGSARAWVIANHATAEDIAIGDFLECVVGAASTFTRPIGVLQAMDAETGTKTADVRQLGSVAKALDDATLFDCEPLSVELTAGTKTATLSAGNITNLDLSVGDYVMFEDLDGSAEINRVTATTSTTISLLIPSVGTYAIADVVHKMIQVEVELI